MFQRNLPASSTTDWEGSLRWITIPLALALVLGGCTGKPAAESVEAGPDSVALARAAYDPAVFDTVTWESQREAIERGQVVYAWSCSKCHGQGGRGDGGYVRAGDTLRPPSFREPGRRFAQDLEGLRRAVFEGNTEGMPHWGLIQPPLRARDIDAVAIFILEWMRGN